MHHSGKSGFFKAVAAALSVVAAAVSCKTVTSFVQGLGAGPVVAKVGGVKLYASELKAYIPNGVSEEDSIRLAMQYINTWASDLIFNDVAQNELTKAEKNVDKELEDYRHSLLKYRYEQKYVNQRLDTAVSFQQIEKYYEDHIANFTLSIPIVKARFLNISPESPNLEIIRKKMTSKKEEDVLEADSIARVSAFRYTDFGDRWIDMVSLSREFGTDYGSVVSQLRDDVIQIPDAGGNLNIAFISSSVRAGETGPVEYFSERIKDIILSTRKQALLSGLERDLIENARDRDFFVVY